MVLSTDSHLSKVELAVAVTTMAAAAMRVPATVGSSREVVGAAVAASGPAALLVVVVHGAICMGGHELDLYARRGRQMWSMYRYLSTCICVHVHVAVGVV